MNANACVVDDRLNDRADLARQDLLIDGRRIPAASGRYFDVMNPATEQVVALVAEADAVDVDAAVRSARAAFEGSWGQIRAAERGHALLRFADVIRRHADKIIGQVIPARTDALTYTVREPLGVVGAIVPWNFPLMIGMWKIAPALACGCTVVLKPAELTPLTALRLGELALEAGLPPGALNVVPGFGKTAGVALVEHPDVDKITFTGSPAVGRQILRGAAGNLKRVTLELGGKSANIIFPDADLDAAVRAASAGIFFNSGQVCSAGSRILVHEDVYQEVVERIAARAASIRLGDPKETTTGMGPLVSAVQMKRVLDYIDIGRREGATVVTGGGRSGEM